MSKFTVSAKYNHTCICVCVYLSHYFSVCVKERKRRKVKEGKTKISTFCISLAVMPPEKMQNLVPELRKIENARRLINSFFLGGGGKYSV